MGTSGFGHESSAKTVSVEWYTPPSIFKALGVIFDLDPCAAPRFDNVLAHKKYRLPVDGLIEPWSGLVFCNPPYGKATASWMRRCADHGNAVALVFARTDTAWFQEAMLSADVVMFLSGRVKFVNGLTGAADGTPGAGSALIGWGAAARDAILQSELGVAMVRPPAN